MTFWVIFDTSTRRDYYRDVLNLLALPPNGTIRYDYHIGHFSAAALAHAEGPPDKRPTRVLLAYAQARNFRKGGGDPKGALPEGEFWLATRIAELALLSRQVDRYNLDLKVLGYPKTMPVTVMEILQPLIQANEAPFSKWVAVSDADAAFNSLAQGEAAENWAALVDVIGAFPSQFEGSSFWRVARVLSGKRASAVEPALVQRGSQTEDQRIVSRVDAVFDIHELDRVVVEIESRLPGPEAGAGAEPDPRSVTISAPTDSPLATFNPPILRLRRFGMDTVQAEVGNTDRVDSVESDLGISTGDGPDKYPLGASLVLRFRVSKSPGRSYFALVLAFLAILCTALGGSLVKDRPGIGISLGVLSAVLYFVAYYLWTGRAKLPGG